MWKSVSRDYVDCAIVLRSACGTRRSHVRLLLEQCLCCPCYSWSFRWLSPGQALSPAQALSPDPEPQPNTQAHKLWMYSLGTLTFCVWKEGCYDLVQFCKWRIRPWWKSFIVASLGHLSGQLTLHDATLPPTRSGECSAIAALLGGTTEFNTRSCQHHDVLRSISQIFYPVWD